MISLILLIVSRLTLAAPYSEDVARIKRGSEQIQKKLRTLGVPEARGTGSTSEKDELPPLFKIHDRMSPISVSQGRLLYGKTLTKLTVGTDGSPFIVILDQGQGWLSGLRVMGNARPGGILGRVVLEGQRIILPGGRTVSVQATALDEQGSYGIEAQVLSGKLWTVAGSIASGFLSGMAASQQTESVNAYGFTQNQKSGKNSVLQGLAQTSADQSKRLIEETTADKPTLIVEPGTPLTILIQEEVKL